jgi:hypothetical protein
MSKKVDCYANIPKILTFIDGSISDITNGGSLNNIAHDKLLDCLVLWAASKIANLT